MANLETTYLGLTLKNPVIVSSSGLSSSLEKIRKIEEAGAGAVILKSLFEEQIIHEAGALSGGSNYPEAADYIGYYTKTNTVDSYLELIEEAKKSVSIPVIASINCVSNKEWVDFTRKIEDAGADALELNVYFLPLDPDLPAERFENTYLDLAASIKQKTQMPLAFKLSNHFTNPISLINKLYHRKVEGVVLFNRFYAPDIDIEKMSMGPADVFSVPADIRNSLRWVGIVSGLVEQIEVSASTGVHSGNAVVKQILAGARTVQICSVLYKKGVEYLETVIADIERWMDNMGYPDLDSFRGKLSYKNIEEPAMYERAQFMKYFSNYH
jgi:dihydroorotate dehydrogenase (fumarate)